MESEMPAFNQLMQDIETDIEDDEKAATASSVLLEAICEHAKDYSVHDKDVQLVYELWPIERHDDIESLLKKCPKFDRFKAIEASVEKLRIQIRKFETEISESIPDIVGEHIESRDYEGMIKNSMQEVTEGYQTLVEHSIETINTKLHGFSLKLDAQVQSDKATAQEVNNRLSELEKSIASKFVLSSNTVEKLANDLQSQKEMNSLVVEDSFSSGIRQGHRSSVFHKMQNRAMPLPDGNVSEESFIGAFIDACNEKGFNCSHDYLRMAHAFLKVSPVVTVSNSSIIDVWLEVLGWQSSILRIAASPVWSNVTDWEEGTDHLFANADTPKVLYIFDFDSGLVEGYLEPILRIWTESGYGSPFDKLYLVNSSSAANIDSSLFRTPVLWLDLLNEKIPLPFIVAPGNSIEHSSDGSGVSPESFLSWSNYYASSPNCAGEGSAGRSYENLVKVLEEFEIQVSVPLNQMLYRTCDTLNQYSINPTMIFSSCLNAIVVPWVVKNCGAQRASELKAYVDSRY